MVGKDAVVCLYCGVGGCSDFACVHWAKIETLEVAFGFGIDREPEDILYFGLGMVLRSWLGLTFTEI